MAIRLFCKEPKVLDKKIKAAFDDGVFSDWKLDSDGDFTFVSEEWENTAWMRPKVLEDRIVFNILGAKSKSMTREVYAVYHCRFVEMLLSHFDTDFIRVTVTALPDKGDILPTVD
ncbi:MAG TPA: hypothetical protein PL193_12440 [Xanthobacteraceae bacterium]|nr:hypothetical protein [Xanthobacteraceae bacterium]